MIVSYFKNKMINPLNAKFAVQLWQVRAFSSKCLISCYLLPMVTDMCKDITQKGAMGLGMSLSHTLSVADDLQVSQPCSLTNLYL